MDLPSLDIYTPGSFFLKKIKKSPEFGLGVWNKGSVETNYIESNIKTRGDS